MTLPRPQLLMREVLPFMLSFGALVAAALLVDVALHLLNVVWIGKYLGIAGTLLILGSFGYSLRKRKLIQKGHPTSLLRWHEGMAWAGSLLVLVHAGIHFNSILAWLAVAAMLINVGSGLAGKFLLARARNRMNSALQPAMKRGESPAEREDRLYWDSLTFDVVKQWRSIHFPITLAFAVLALAHVIAATIFWAWK
jgi:UPF0716 family protein affecting phage T7 exclusion